MEKSFECDDAISREDVIEATHHCGDLQEVRAVVRDLPSVTQKSGKWIITHLSHTAYCSECDYIFKDIPASIVEHFKHCPNCGAKMVEPQENEKVNCKSTKCENCINHNYCDYEPQERSGEE